MKAVFFCFFSKIAFVYQGRPVGPAEGPSVGLAAGSGHGSSVGFGNISAVGFGDGLALGFGDGFGDGLAFAFGDDPPAELKYRQIKPEQLADLAKELRECFKMKTVQWDSDGKDIGENRFVYYSTTGHDWIKAGRVADHRSEKFKFLPKTEGRVWLNAMDAKDKEVVLTPHGLQEKITLEKGSDPLDDKQQFTVIWNFNNTMSFRIGERLLAAVDNKDSEAHLAMGDYKENRGSTHFYPLHCKNDSPILFFPEQFPAGMPDPVHKFPPELFKCFKMETVHEKGGGKGFTAIKYTGQDVDPILNRDVGNFDRFKLKASYRGRFMLQGLESPRKTVVTPRPGNARNKLEMAIMRKPDDPKVDEQLYNLIWIDDTLCFHGATGFIRVDPTGMLFEDNNETPEQREARQFKIVDCESGKQLKQMKVAAGVDAEGGGSWLDSAKDAAVAGIKSLIR